MAASQAVLDAVFGPLAGYGISGGDTIDATRAPRSGLARVRLIGSCRGVLDARDADRSFERLVDVLTNALDNWARD